MLFVVVCQSDLVKVQAAPFYGIYTKYWTVTKITDMEMLIEVTGATII
jgi:hypothetical protein